MKLLILGGTVFAGRALASLSVAAGHDVTIFHRGQRHAPEVESRVRTLIGDRDGKLEALRPGTWDCCVDFSGYVPRIVDYSAALLEKRVGRYVFISTISVYQDFAGARDEDSPRAVLDDPTMETLTGVTYGPLKAACEDVVLARYGRRATIVRPGLIVGPHDASDRYTYWIRRFGKGGEILGPGDGGRLVQIVDVRDLAAFCLKLAQDDRGGTFNVKGEPTRIADVLQSIQEVTPAESHVRWVPEDYLLAHGAEPWMELPMWLAGHDQNDRCDRARAAGLTTRPLSDTARATREWDLTRDPAVPLKAGMAPDKEKALLAGFGG